MSRKSVKRPSGKPAPKGAGNRRQGVVEEAWAHYRRDLSRLLPASLVEKLEKRPGRWKWAVALAVLELLVLGVVVKLVWEWATG